MDTSQPPGLIIAQVLLLQAHFAHREDALRLPPNYAVGEISVKVELRYGNEADGKKALVIVAASTVPEQNPVYHFHIEMAALINTDPDAPNLSPEEYAKSHGPGLLYPFIRETVASLTNKGRFGPIWLKPTNFVASTDARLTVESPSSPADAEKDKTPES